LIRPNLWYLPPAFFVAGGPWVRSSPGIPCALSSFEDAPFAKLGHTVPRERKRALCRVIARSEATKQSKLSPR
jgi:hypothetical protein